MKNKKEILNEIDKQLIILNGLILNLEDNCNIPGNKDFYDCLNSAYRHGLKAKEYINN